MNRSPNIAAINELNRMDGEHAPTKNATLKEVHIKISHYDKQVSQEVIEHE